MCGICGVALSAPLLILDLILWIELHLTSQEGLYLALQMVEVSV